MTPEKDPTKTSSSMNLQVQTWNLTRGCSLCSARHWPSTSRNLADLGEVSPRSLPFFYPKKKRQQKNQCVFYRPRFKASMSDTLHASLHVHLWEPKDDFSGFSLEAVPGVSEGNANAERKPFTTSEIQQKLKRGCKQILGNGGC